MGYKTDMIELAAFSGVLIILSLAGIVWDVASRLIFSGIDGILLLFVCLMTGGVFTLQLFMAARKAGWLPARAPKSGKEAAAPAKAAAPRA
jgi:hypothetical protein